MTITSFSFLAFIVIGAVLYYVLPKSLQWIELLIMSLVFYCFAAVPYTVIFIIFTTVVSYIATNIGRLRAVRESNKQSIISVSVAIAIILNTGLWFVIKGGDFWRPVLNAVGLEGKAAAIPAVAALGMGYYTLQAIGYILDCHWQTITPQKNILKLFLFLVFFPQMTTGPVSRYEQLETLFQKHKFSYTAVTHGAQRILWGFFKKIVIAERAGLIVNGIWANMDTFSGFYSWAALLLYPLQMYADFSGCMDIVIGVSEIFGIKLAENFKNPFFSRTVQEFWQRWHITLGAWAKDYVLYPLLKSRFMVGFSRAAKKRFGKKTGKVLPTALGMAVLWLVMGIWHGNVKYIVGVSLWYWAILMLGEFLSPFLQKLMKLMSIDGESFSWHLFQSSRTYLIYAVGAVFFRAPDMHEAGRFLGSLAGIFKKANPWIFFDSSVLGLGITHTDLNILILGVLMLILVAVLREKYGYARIWMDKQILVFRWMIWIGLFVIVLVYGKYGPGYSAAEFIYQGF